MAGQRIYVLVRVRSCIYFFKQNAFCLALLAIFLRISNRFP